MPRRFRSGIVKVKVKFRDSADDSCARLVLGYNAETEDYFSVGIGGYKFAYVSDICIGNRAWRAHKVQGTISQVMANREYEIEARVSGQRVVLLIDGVEVLADVFPFPLAGDQAGLFAWGPKPVEFRELAMTADDRSLFVVMQFGEPYDSIYTDVVKPVSENSGFTAFRADDVFRPGVILQDIKRGIIESDVILAEITPVNPNVFYELGYAHALGKPTVLLADRKVDKLPFDVSGYRVIFYDNTISGKLEIEATLKKHLDNIKSGTS